MRTLVVFLAQTRSHALTWESALSNMIGPFGADVAVCAGFPGGGPDDSPIVRASKHVWAVSEPDDFGTLYDAMASERNMPPFDRSLLGVKDQWLGGIHGVGGFAKHRGSSAIVLYFKQLAMDRILDLGLDRVYDRFIFTRSDNFHGAPHPDVGGDGMVWVPMGEDYGGVCDRHWVMGPEMVGRAMRLVEPLLADPSGIAEAMSAKSDWNPEQYIGFWWNRSGVWPHVRRMPRTMYLVRGKDDPTRWQRGAWNDEVGMIVKYRSEYEQFLRDQGRR